MITRLFGPAFAWAALLRLGGAPLDIPEPGSTVPAVEPAPAAAAPSPIERLLRLGAGLRRPPAPIEDAALDLDDALDAGDLAAPDPDRFADPFDDPEEEP